MAKKMVDITGERFGMLTAISPMEERSANGQMRWLCLCDCGEYAIYPAGQLRQRNVKSCGCLKKRIEQPRYAELPQAFRDCTLAPNGKFETGCVALLELMCVTRGKCSFYSPPKDPEF